MALNQYSLLAMFAVTALSSVTLRADDNVLEVRQQGNIIYVTGGIGKDETDALQVTRQNFNLQIMNADKTGHFYGDTHILISDMQNHVLLNTTSGPIFYANLPKGKYVIQGYNQGLTRMQSITIAYGKPVYIRFFWPEDLTYTSN